MLCVEGQLLCEKQELLGKVRDDVYAPICELPCQLGGGLEMELIVGGSKTRGGIRAEPYRVKISSGNQVSVRVIRGNRAPMSLHLTGIVIPLTGRTVPMIFRPSLLGKTIVQIAPEQVSVRRLGDWIFLNGQLQLDAAGYKELSSLLPVECRPSADLEFPVIHNGVSMCRIYTDGRVVVDSGIAVSECSSSSAVFARKGSVWLSSVRFAISEGERVDLCGNRPVPGQEVKLHFQAGLAMLQGKLAVARMHTPCSVPRDFENDPSVALLAQLPVSPSSNLTFFALNKVSTPNIADRYSRLVLDVNGALWGAGFEAGNVRVISVSGIVFVPTKNSAPPNYSLLPLFTSRLDPAHWQALQSAMAEGIFDYASRVLGAGKLDVDQLDHLLLAKLVSVEKAKSIKRCVGGWATQVAGASEVPVTDLAELLTPLLVSEWQLERLLERIKKFVATKSTSHPQGSMEVVQRPAYHQSARASLIDTMRFNGRKCMHQLKIAKKAEPEEIEVLNEIVNWWHQWSSNDRQLTHSSLMGNQDIFTDTGKWTIPDDPDVQAVLFKYMAWIYKRGYDTFISEIQTPLFPLIEDLDMESTLQMEDTKSIDDMFTDKLFFIKERARALRVIYPHIDEFTVYVYSSSGFNKSKGRWKSSFHLVWPQVIVNGHLAPIVRQTTVEHFIYKSTSSTYFKRMQTRLINHYEANIWENVFDQTTSNALNGLRMPFCNKATWIKTNFGSKSPSVENRHCFPKGAIRIRFEPVEFGSPAELAAAEARAMALILEAEKRDTSELNNMPLIRDQNTLVGDRTQYKQSDKNSIHRTSAFFAGMKNAGGDRREFHTVHAEWTEEVHNVHELSEAEVAVWIQRGSCRRQMNGSTKLTEFDKTFVECYEKADLEFFAGHTIDTLRETELWHKMTPAAQAGLKARFRKYLQSSSGLGVKTGGLSDLARLAQLAQTAKAAQVPTEERVRRFEEEFDVFGDDQVLPPMGTENEEFAQFDVWPDQLPNVFSFRKTKDEFVTQLQQLLEGGYWIHSPLSATWVSPREAPRTNGWSSCMQIDYGNRKPTQQVSASLYYHCGKVILSGPTDSSAFNRLVLAVTKIAEPDDRLYHRLNMPEEYEQGFPLIDHDKALLQREEYERRWSGTAQLRGQHSSMDIFSI